MYGPSPVGVTTPEVSVALILTVTVTRPELISTELGETVNDESIGACMSWLKPS